MDKYEYNLKIEQIKAFLENENYKEAELLADTINWNKIRNVNILVKLGEVYEKVERYDESREILLNAYDRSPIGRNILYRLTEVAIKMKDFDAAAEYYQEFVEIAPYDAQKYVLKYQLMQAQEATLPELILVLEEFKEQEYIEEWVYELAYLYHKAGQVEKCVEACDELVLWFGDGTHVEKALELKMLYQPLTEAQEEKYKEFCRLREGTAELGEQEMQSAQDSIVIPQVTVNPERFNTVNLQEEIVKGMQELMENAQENNDIETIEAIRKLTKKSSDFSTKEDEKSFCQTEESNLGNSFYQSLREGSDGQLQFVLSEKAISERPIEGQIHLEDILAELEYAKTNVELQSVKEDIFESNIQSTDEQSVTLEVQNTECKDSTFEKLEKNTEKVELEVQTEKNNKIGVEITNSQNPQVEFDIGNIENSQMDLQTEETESDVPNIEGRELAPKKSNTFQASENIMDRLSDVIPKIGKGITSRKKAEQEYKNKREISQPMESDSILTEEQKGIFSYFVPVHDMEEQLGKALDGIITRLLAKDTAATGNLIIQGNKGCGKTVLATCIVKVLQKEGVFENGKVGKIEARALNRKDIGQLLEKVSGGCLIIESAGELEQTTAITLSRLLEQDRSGMFVVLEDSEAGIQRAISRDAGFASKFTERITVPIFTNDELVSFAKSYANELGYIIDAVAILALHNRICSIEKVDQETRLEEVKEIIDEAIKKEANSGIRKAFNILTAKRYTDDERIVLTEKDFE